MIFIGSILLCISHLILSYRFYHVTHHLKNQIDSYQVAQSDETKWMASQLKDVRDQAQVWMKESMRQRQQLLDLMQ
ncbi:hypothetical protein BJ944DRAFT_260096 [Cunninghamella echinulata]|nr:hypothetical protein BJ944DRAFT_260096 [Cunninghamella echinulata]